MTDFCSKITQAPDKITKNKTIKTVFVPLPCTLCGNGCQVSPLEQFKVRNGLCEAREQMYRRTMRDE